eukprot:TRINITY_DN11450_c0_g1_i1.p1 TRINITY_DN11450_c0_g1~~TRINITY_DN11450_c0_g1_i1.p1  ORF type:complete len:532 (+),score=112.76 TRINITY_DN11450_c0_g1_i1:66-1661(+)
MMLCERMFGIAAAWVVFQSANLSTAQAERGMTTDTRALQFLESPPWPSQNPDELLPKTSGRPPYLSYPEEWKPDGTIPMGPTGSWNGKCYTDERASKLGVDNFGFKLSSDKAAQAAEERARNGVANRKCMPSAKAENSKQQETTSPVTTGDKPPIIVQEGSAPLNPNTETPASVTSEAQPALTAATVEKALEDLTGPPEAMEGALKQLEPIVQSVQSLQQPKEPSAQSVQSLQQPKERDLPSSQSRADVSKGETEISMHSVTAETEKTVITDEVKQALLKGPADAKLPPSTEKDDLEALTAKEEAVLRSKYEKMLADKYAGQTAPVQVQAVLPLPTGNDIPVAAMAEGLPAVIPDDSLQRLEVHVADAPQDIDAEMPAEVAPLEDVRQSDLPAAEEPGLIVIGQVTGSESALMQTEPNQDAEELVRTKPMSLGDMFSMFDENKDGRLDVPEAIMYTHHLKVEAMLRSHFGHHTISLYLQEAVDLHILEFSGGFQISVHKSFLLADANGDNMVSMDEFEQFTEYARKTCCER